MKYTTNSEGDVLWDWVKIMAGGKGNTSAAWYKDSPGYYEIAKNGDNTIFAFKRPIDPENPLPHSLQKCNDFEINKLNKMEDERNHVF